MSLVLAQRIQMWSIYVRKIQKEIVIAAVRAVAWNMEGVILWRGGLRGSPVWMPIHSLKGSSCESCCKKQAISKCQWDLVLSYKTDEKDLNHWTNTSKVGMNQRLRVLSYWCRPLPFITVCMKCSRLWSAGNVIVEDYESRAELMIPQTPAPF